MVPSRRAAALFAALFAAPLGLSFGCAGSAATADAAQDARNETAGEPSPDGAPEAALESGPDGAGDAALMCSDLSSVDWGFTAACVMCLEDKCCAEATECRGTKDCPALFKCLHGCSPTGSCYMDCLTRYPDGTVASSKVDGCVYAKCPMGCRMGG